MTDETFSTNNFFFGNLESHRITISGTSKTIYQSAPISHPVQHLFSRQNMWGLKQ